MGLRHASEPSGRPAVNALRLVFATGGVLSLLLGYLGLAELLRGSDEFGHRAIDVIYYDLQLFVLGADPLQQGGRYTWPLEIARFAAPATTIYAFCEIALRLFSAEVRRVQARLARGHVVVAGEGPIAVTLIRRLRRAGKYVVYVQPTAEPILPSGRGLVTLVGDPRQPEALRTAGLRHATALYACDDQESAFNTAVMSAAQRVARIAAEPLAVYVHIRDPELCLVLQAQDLGDDPRPGMRLDFFNIDDLAARNLFSGPGLTPVNGRPPRVVVAGLTDFGCAVVVAAVRSWREVAQNTPTVAATMPLVIVDPAARQTVAKLIHRYPFLRTSCELTVYDADLAELLVRGELREPPDRAYICHSLEDHALKTAMVADRLWRSQPQSIVVRLDQIGAYQDLRSDHPRGGLFNEADSSVQAFDAFSAACHPKLIGDDLVERIARVLHEHYRLARQRNGVGVTVDPAPQSWDELAEEIKESNRRVARDIGHKLSEMRCVLIPRIEQDRNGVFTDAEIDRLAEMEHERWIAEKEANGWRYGPRRDDGKLLHPGMMPWDELPDWLRQRDEEIVREIPAILSDAGFQILHR